MKKKFIVFSLTSLTLMVFIFFTMNHLQEKKINTVETKNSGLKVDINTENQPFIGDPNAPITIVEFFDLKCPPCWQWKKNTYPILKTKYVDTKKAKIVFINSPLKSHGEDAYLGALSLEASYKQNKESFIILLDELFNYQESPDKTWITKDLIKNLANKINNFDSDKLIRDLNNEEVKKEVDNDLNIAQNAQVNSTPTIYINNRRVESAINTENGKQIKSNPFDLIKIDKIIQEELEKTNK
ncbi:thioredoxin domain-containing protein [Bacillus mycoides]|uniref:thioredoxin domain-containing protein n=1 Tax=Bacillus mycoides TaxID=1405 RepID=UPI003D064776